MADKNQYPYSEQTLLAAVSSGDAAAFTELVGIYWAKTYSYALAFLKSPAEAEDLTQDVYLKIWDKRKDLAKVTQFSDYLFIVTRNLLISEFRKKKMRLVSTVSLLTDEQKLVPDRQLEAKQLSVLVARAVEQLPQQQKMVYERVTLHGQKYEDIALEMGISKRTVRFHMASALSSLKGFIRYHSDEK